jgi:NAD(P)-dependent dehydrogenase (short-subunit alcohol dehydrogenase family)
MNMMSPYSYIGKTVLVIGATSGIGRAIAMAFAHAGANLVVLGRNQQKNEQLQQELIAIGAKTEVIAGSITNELDVQRAVGIATDRFGTLDIAINNAGVLDTELKPLHQKSQAEYDAVFDINVRGLFFALKHELNTMLPNKAGVIINVSSVAGSRGGPMMSLYVASKHAVEGLTKSAALEAAPHGIRVLALRPHAVETPMVDALVGAEESPARAGLRQTVPLGRLGLPDEQAKVVLFLCSEDASYMTGSPVCVDGGYHAG